MKLREVVDRVMDANDWDQTALGKKLGAAQPMVSRMRKGDEWEIHWQVFLKLLPLIADLKMIRYKELIPMSDKVDEQMADEGLSNPLKSQEEQPKKPGQNPVIMSPENEFSYLLH